MSAKTRDVTELLVELGLPPLRDPPGITVAYHSACSMQHGQKVEEPPRALLARAGYAVREIPEGHLCCGSAGTYNVLQPEIAARLRERKLANIARTGASVVATGNIGCITQLAAAAGLPIVHTVELLDWATGGPAPPALRQRADVGARIRTPGAWAPGNDDWSTRRVRRRYCSGRSSGAPMPEEPMNSCVPSGNVTSRAFARCEPSFAMNPCTTTFVPGGSELRFQPRRSSALGAPPSTAHSSTVPSGFVTLMCSHECGLTQRNSLTVPSIVTG